jgi:hypothetical protein
MIIPELPEWFSAALHNTRKNYQRIDVSKQLCPYCGCAIHVATNWIGVPEQKEEMSLQDFRASVYPFCACAQAMESERLGNMVMRTDEYWTKVADWYHEHIARAESDKHRENMLRGYPNYELLKFIIDPNQ